MEMKDCQDKVRNFTCILAQNRSLIFSELSGSEMFTKSLWSHKLHITKFDSYLFSGKHGSLLYTKKQQAEFYVKDIVQPKKRGV